MLEDGLVDYAGGPLVAALQSVFLASLFILKLNWLRMSRDVAPGMCFCTSMIFVTAFQGCSQGRV